MRSVVLLLLAAACAPDATVGKTIASVDVADLGSAFASSDGRLVEMSKQLTLRERTGAVAWAVPCDCAGGNGTFDAAGDIYIAALAVTNARIQKRSAADGSIVWSKEYPLTNAIVLVDGADVVWLLSNTSTAVDFGGGPVPSGYGTAFARFTMAGEYLSSGRWFLETSLALPLPGGGLVVRALGSGNLVAFAEDGTKRWAIALPCVDAAVHADGSLSVTQPSDPVTSVGGDDLVLARYDAAATEQWRQQLHGEYLVTPVEGGGVVATGRDGLSDEVGTDVSTLAYFKTDGTPVTREVFEDDIRVVGGEESNGVWLYDGHELVRRAITDE